jgi:hypothetical protein
MRPSGLRIIETLVAVLVAGGALAACSSEKPEKAIVVRWFGDLASLYWERSVSRRVEDVAVEVLVDHTATVRLRATFKWPSEVRDTIETKLTWTILEDGQLKSEDPSPGETYLQKIVAVSSRSREIDGDGPLQGRFFRR